MQGLIKNALAGHINLFDYDSISKCILNMIGKIPLLHRRIRIPEKSPILVTALKMFKTLNPRNLF